MKQIKRTAGEKAIERLEAQGWECSHDATCNRYQFAGTVSEMRTRGGYEYCRVHHGKSVGRWCYQLTTVMRRPVVA